MKNNTKIKEKIYWVGEHSHEVFKNTDQLILNNFDNQVLLYSRIDSEFSLSAEIVYLDEFFPMKERNYVISDLQKPISQFMKDRNIPFEKGLIIGDASEILVQALIEVSTFEESNLNRIKETVSEFEVVHKIDPSDEFNMVDVSGFSMFFLKEAMPFKDSLILSNQYKTKATKTFHQVISQKDSEFKMNEFLFHLENGLDEAVVKSKGLEFC